MIVLGFLAGVMVSSSGYHLPLTKATMCRMLEKDENGVAVRFFT
jgi:hypothetical protein